MRSGSSTTTTPPGPLAPPSAVTPAPGVGEMDEQEPAVDDVGAARTAAAVRVDVAHHEATTRRRRRVGLGHERRRRVDARPHAPTGRPRRAWRWCGPGRSRGRPRSGRRRRPLRRRAVTVDSSGAAGRGEHRRQHGRGAATRPRCRRRHSGAGRASARPTRVTRHGRPGGPASRARSAGPGGRAYLLGWGVTRRYGLRRLKPLGNFFSASSSDTAGTTMTSSPSFQFTGVATW